MYCWGDIPAWIDQPTGIVNTTPGAVPGLTDVSELATSRGGHGCAIKQNGEVWCWGIATALFAEPELTQSPPTRVEGLPEDQTIGEVVTSWDASCALTSDKEIWCWGRSNALGYDPNPEDSWWIAPTRIDGITDEVVEITAAAATYCARTVKGEVWCWGMRLLGEDAMTPTPKPERLMSLSDVRSLGYGTTMGLCAIVGDGEVKCWGIGDTGQLGSEDPMAGLVAPIAIPGLSGVTSVGTGAAHSCALTSVGDVYCWGNNDLAQLGREGASSVTPVQVANVSNVVDLSVSTTHNCVRRANDEIVCWGFNDSGQLGRGTRGESHLDAEPVLFEWGDEP